MAKTNHNFSPILDEERLKSAAKYIAKNSLSLASKVLGRELNIDTICFFAQSLEEYDFLKHAVQQRGPKSKFTHGATLYVDSDFEILDQQIKLFGVRKPDPTRPWVGYGDYPVSDFENMYEATKAKPNVRFLKSGRGQPLLELSHPDFDVLGFIVDAKVH